MLCNIIVPLFSIICYHITQDNSNIKNGIFFSNNLIFSTSYYNKYSPNPVYWTRNRNTYRRIPLNYAD